MEDGHSESLFNLVEVTDEVMAKYHVDEAPRVVASIAQRVNMKKKIELSIAYVGFSVCLFPLLLTYFDVASGRKVRPCQRGHSASDSDRRIPDNAPEECRPWWSHVEEMLAGHP